MCAVCLSESVLVFYKHGMQGRSLKTNEVLYQLAAAVVAHCESKKGCHPNHGYNFVNSWSICKILSLLQTVVNFQQNPYWVTHHTLSMLLLYRGKLKNHTFAILMHVKHVSNVAFYHLSNKCLPSVMKINVKINTMQNTNILVFVRSLSLTNWRNA